MRLSHQRIPRFLSAVVLLVSAVPGPGAAPAPPAGEPPATILDAVPPELRFHPRPVPAEANAFPHWERACELLTEENADIPGLATTVSGGDAAFPVGDEAQILMDYLARNAEALEAFDRGIGLGVCRFPPITGPDTPLPYLADLRTLARLKMLRARLLLSVGDIAPGVRDIADLFTVADMIADGDGALIHVLVAQAIRQLGVRGTGLLLALPDVPAENALEPLRLALDAGIDPREAIRRVYRLEFSVMFVEGLRRMEGEAGIRTVLDLVRQVNGGDLSELQRKTLEAGLAEHPKPFDAAETVELAAGAFLPMMRAIDAPWEFGRDPAVAADKERRNRLAARMETIRTHFEKATSDTGTDEDHRAFVEALVAEPNPLGRFVVNAFVPSFETIFARLATGYAEHSAMRVLVGAAIFRGRTGALPGSLDELVASGCLSEFPLDPYSGGPLRYSLDSRRVWSVGPDGRDDGGKGTPGDLRAGPDLVWSLAF